MKKFINPIPFGGMPVHTNRFQNELNIEIWTALEAICQSISDPVASGNVGVIVAGCKVTGAGPYNMSAGIVYMNGQFMAHPGFTGLALPQYIVPAAAVNIAKTFADGSSKNLIVQQDATTQNSVPGGGQYITLSTTGNLGGLGGFRIENFVNPGVTAAITAAINAIPSWNNFTLINSWTNIGSSVARWRKWPNGQVDVWAQLTTPAGLNQNWAATPAGFSMPGSPTVNVILPVSSDATAVDKFYELAINTSNLFFAGSTLVNGRQMYVNVSFIPNDYA